MWKENTHTYTQTYTHSAHGLEAKARKRNRPRSQCPLNSIPLVIPNLLRRSYHMPTAPCWWAMDFALSILSLNHSMLQLVEEGNRRVLSGPWKLSNGCQLQHTQFKMVEGITPKTLITSERWQSKQMNSPGRKFQRERESSQHLTLETLRSDFSVQNCWEMSLHCFNSAFMISDNKCTY